jgi:carbon-monoxide dehydrogenase medium subunit
MKPPLFEYVTPPSLDAAIEALTTYDSKAVLAGGQSLIPTLNFRLGTPDAIVDIGQVPGLRNIDFVDDKIKIGAMVRQRQVELDSRIYKANPLLREALSYVAHIPIRNRGTLVGSLAHADAAAELPAVLLATGGTVEVKGTNGIRLIAAEDLFRFHLTTTVRSDEIITAAYFPELPPNSGWAIGEVTRRRGDYAVAGVCVLLSLNGDGTCATANLTAFGIGTRTIRLNAVEQKLIGNRLDAQTLADAGHLAADYVEVADDAQTSEAYRIHVLTNLVTRTVKRATLRANQ